MSDNDRMPPRYGFDVNGYARQMYDGYWTPWHIAKDEITALRAALDQERAKVAALRETIEACGEWSPNSRGKLIFHFGDRWIADDETLAMLSGRGEVSDG